MADRDLVRQFLEISKAHRHVTVAQVEPLQAGSFPADAMEVVEVGYALPDANGRYVDVRSHRTAAAHVAVKARTEDEYGEALADTPAGRLWLAFAPGTLFFATDRKPDRPIFEVMGDDDRDKGIYDVEPGYSYTGLIV